MGFDSQINQNSSDIKINVVKQKSSKAKDSFMPIREEFQISFDFDNEEENDEMRDAEVI